MNKRYFILLFFVILMIISFNKFGNSIRKKLIIIIYFIFLQFKSIFKIIKYKINKKNYNKHPLGLTKVLNTQLIKIKDSHPIRKEKCIYLFNHRSWADFWIDYDIVGGACYISRKLLKYVLGFVGILGSTVNDLLFFNRNDTKDRHNLYKKILEKLKIKNIILYPEGTRNIQNISKPLKFGVIKLAYDNNIPLQIIICKNKEKVFNLKKLEYTKNINCPYYVSKVIYPKNHIKLDDFIKYVENKWNESWNKLYK